MTLILPVKIGVKRDMAIEYFGNAAAELIKRDR